MSLMDMNPEHFGPSHPRIRIKHSSPHLCVEAHGMIGPLPWTICRHGDNLRVSIGRQEIDISTPNEMRQAQALCSALSKAMAEAILR